jgi:hypothetical protein
LVASDDKMIPPDAQRAMSKRAGSAIEAVAKFIETAAKK